LKADSYSNGQQINSLFQDSPLIHSMRISMTPFPSSQFHSLHPEDGVNMVFRNVGILHHYTVS